MVWLFLVPLGVAIAAFFIFERSQDELAVLSIVIGLGGLLLSLILAPWQIQLVVLAIALFLSRHVVSSQSNNAEF